MRTSELPNDVVFEIARMFIEGAGASRIYKEANRRWNLGLTREQVYPIVREARSRGFLGLFPPPDVRLRQRLSDYFRKPLEAIDVVDADGPSSNDQVVTVTAERILELIQGFVERGQQSVHLGLGAGPMVLSVTKTLAGLLEHEERLPKLVLHTLSPGFDPRRPAFAPNSYFAFFDSVQTEKEYLGLLAPAVVHTSDYENFKRLPGVRESFEDAGEIDIVITSLASAEDEHGELRRYMAFGGEQEVETLRDAGWIGDVQYRPYSAEGPLIDLETDLKPITLFELTDLVELARPENKNKHVVLAVAPCGVCHRQKDDALVPLLREPNLAVWSHLIVDRGTAQAALREAGGAVEAEGKTATMRRRS